MSSFCQHFITIKLVSIMYALNMYFKTFFREKNRITKMVESCPKIDFTDEPTIIAMVSWKK